MLRLAPTALLVFLLAACTSPPRLLPATDNFVALDLARPLAGSLVVLLPPQGEDRDLLKGEAQLTDALNRTLVANGYRVAILEVGNYAVIWDQEVEAVGGIYDQSTGKPRTEAYSTALAQLARRVCQELKCSLLIRHRLVGRMATLDKRVARWDGQERMIQLKSTAGSTWEFSGSQPALSVELLGLTAAGQLAFLTFGGASLPFAADIVGAKSVLRTDLFRDPTEVLEGVAIALKPVLAKLQ